MTWVRIDDEFYQHPKVVRAGPLASWLHIAGLCYSARYLTDGFVPDRQVRLLADLDNPWECAAKLVEVGLWERREGGYQIHDYLEYNPSREKVLEEREAARERRATLGRVSGERRATFGENSGDVRPNAGENSGERNEPRTPSPSPSPNPIPEPVAAAADETAAAAAADSETVTAFVSALETEWVAQIGPPAPALLADARLFFAEYAPEVSWAADAVKEAVLYGAPNWPYVRTVLRRWCAEGRGPPEKGRPKAADNPDKYLEEYRRRRGHSPWEAAEE